MEEAGRLSQAAGSTGTKGSEREVKLSNGLSVRGGTRGLGVKSL